MVGFHFCGRLATVVRLSNRVPDLGGKIKDFLSVSTAKLRFRRRFALYGLPAGASWRGRQGPALLLYLPQEGDKHDSPAQAEE